MRLGTRIFLALLTVFVISVSLNYAVFHFFVLDRADTLEKNIASENMEMFKATLHRELTHFELFVSDWAAWNDTYLFVQDKNKGYIESNLVPDTFFDNKINLIHIYDSKGNCMWKKSYDLKSNKPISLDIFSAGKNSPNSLLLNHPQPDSKVAGVLTMKEGPVLIASYPIITSDNKGPIKGTIIMGRILTIELMKSIMEQTRLNVRFWPISNIPSNKIEILSAVLSSNSNLTLEADEDEVQTYAVINDIVGKPAIFLEGTSPRKIYKQNVAMFRFAFISFLTIGLVILVSIAIFFNIFILRPLKELTDRISKVSKTANLFTSVQMDRSDEFGTLSQNFQTMMQKLATTQKSLVDESYKLGIAEMAMGTLHNIGNAVNPIKVRSQILSENLNADYVRNINRAFREIKSNSTDESRKFKLIEFLEKTNMHQEELIKSTLEYLQFTTKQISVMDGLLEQQKGYSTADRPLESLPYIELIHEAINQIPRSMRDVVDILISKKVLELRPVLAERIRLFHVVHNVLLNACEALVDASVGSKQIIITGQPVIIQNKRGVELSIHDNGIGIERAILERVFEREYTSKSKDHSGIGLHWCANAVSSMNGSIKAYSDGLGKGALFTITLLEAMDVG